MRHFRRALIQGEQMPFRGLEPSVFTEVEGARCIDGTGISAPPGREPNASWLREFTPSPPHVAVVVPRHKYGLAEDISVLWARAALIRLRGSVAELWVLLPVSLGHVFSRV